MADPYVSPLFGEQSLKNYTKTALRTGPDYSSVDKAYSNLMSNPSLFARGGNFVDPTQAQSDAGQGFLQQRGQIGQDWLQNQNNLAGVSANSGSALGQITSFQDIIKALTTQGGTAGLNGILGGL